MADENGAIDVERVEQRHEIGGEAGNRIARVRMIRLAEPALIERDEAQRARSSGSTRENENHESGQPCTNTTGVPRASPDSA